MRSYLDTLIEYDSQSSFKELQLKWTYFLADKLACQDEDFSVFQNQQHQTNLFQLDHNYFNFYPVHEAYQKLIGQLENYFDSNLRIRLKEDILSWLVFNSKAKSAVLESQEKYDLAATYNQWYEANHSIIENDAEANYFDTLKQTWHGRVLIRAIEQFYNHKLDNYSLIAKETQEITPVSDFEFNFRNQDSFININQERVRVNSGIKSIINFSKDDVYALVFRINKSKIHIDGEFKGIRKVPVKMNNWFSQELIELILEKKHISLEQYIPKGLSEELMDVFNLKHLYISEEVELELSIYNSFSDAEVEYMKDNIREVFPFYFIHDKSHQVNIEKVSNDLLKISLRTSEDQIIGSIAQRRNQDLEFDLD